MAPRAETGLGTETSAKMRITWPPRRSGKGQDGTKRALLAVATRQRRQRTVNHQLHSNRCREVCGVQFLNDQSTWWSTMNNRCLGSTATAATHTHTHTHTHADHRRRPQNHQLRQSTHAPVATATTKSPRHEKWHWIVAEGAKGSGRRVDCSAPLRALLQVPDLDNRSMSRKHLAQHEERPEEGRLEEGAEIRQRIARVDSECWWTGRERATGSTDGCRLTDRPVAATAPYKRARRLPTKADKRGGAHVSAGDVDGRQTASGSGGSGNHWNARRPTMTSSV